MEVKFGNWQSTWNTADDYISRFNPKSAEHTTFNNFLNNEYTTSAGMQVKVTQIGTERRTSPGIGSKFNFVPNSEVELPGVTYITPLNLDITAIPFNMYDGTVNIPEFRWTRPAVYPSGINLIKPNQLGQY